MALIGFSSCFEDETNQMGKHKTLIQSVSILIPIYNEAATVLELLDRVLKQPLPADLKKEVIIVESNSTDGTRELVQKFVSRYQVSEKISLRLILQDRALGKGHAARQAMGVATGDIILIQDGDLEYDTADYPQLIQPLLDGHADFVLGSRHLSAGSWKIRKFVESPLKAFYMNLGGSLFHTGFNWLYGSKLTDPTTMYKVFLRSCIHGIAFECNRFDFDFELVAKLIRLGFTPLEVPVSYQSRGFEKGKKVNILRDPFMWVWSIVKFRFKKIKRLSRAELNGLSTEILEKEWRQQKSLG
jgi:glycosyltransferase involved in cell wall biosynthesis